jgi:hypothetical protein
MLRWSRSLTAHGSAVDITALSMRIGNKTTSFRDRSSAKALFTSSSTQSLAIELFESIKRRSISGVHHQGPELTGAVALSLTWGVADIRSAHTLRTAHPRGVCRLKGLQ